MELYGASFKVVYEVALCPPDLAPQLLFLSVKKRVMAQFSEVVLYDHTPVPDFPDHIGQERHFPAPTRQIYDKMGHRRPRDPVSEFSKNSEPCADWGPEMTRAPGEVHLHQVIGADPNAKQPLEQFGQDGFGVVYAAQKDRLAAKWNACV